MSKPVEAGSLKVNQYLMIEGVPCRIVECEKSKPGKHGSAKVRIVGISVIDNLKKSMVCPADMKVNVPIIEKRSGQVVSLSETAVQLMDLESYDVFWAALPTEEEVKSKLVPGSEVEYWKVLDRIKIMRVKGS